MSGQESGRPVGAAFVTCTDCRVAAYFVLVAKLPGACLGLARVSAFASPPSTLRLRLQNEGFSRRANEAARLTEALSRRRRASSHMAPSHVQALIAAPQAKTSSVKRRSL